MIAQARTPRGLSWAARLGVLGLAALILPLAPTWAQKPDAPDPDRAPDPAAAAAKETLQELTKELRHPVLVSDSTRALMRDDERGLEFVNDFDVRGKKERVRLWTLAPTPNLAPVGADLR